MFIDDWFINLPASDLQPHVEETNALEDFLSGFISPQSAAEKLTAVTSSTKDNVEEGLCRLWRILLAIGKNFPDTQDELVQLIGGIKALPDLKLDGEIVTVGELKVWRDLPLFGSEIRSYWINFSPKAETQYEWLNVNAFAARCTADQTLDLKIYGLWTLRVALENGSSNGPSSDDLQLLDFVVPAAAQWILHAGKAIFNCGDVVQEDEIQGNDLATVGLWKGKPGFCKERWTLWKKRFELAHSVEELNAVSREVARQATKAMEEIESEA